MILYSYCPTTREEETVPRITVPSPSQAAAYMERLAVVNDKFKQLGYGARQDAAFDLRISPSRLSGVLNYREPNEDILTQLEGWATEKLAARDSS